MNTTRFLRSSAAGSPRRPAVCPAPVALSLVLTAGLAFLSASAASAQTPFALVNVGAHIESYDARMDGRGGWGMAESDTLIPNYKNLAALSGMNKVAMLFCGYGELTTTDYRTDLGEGRRQTSRVLAPTIRAAIPLFGSRVAFTAGFRALRGTQYETIQPQTWFFPEQDLTLVGDEAFDREGTQYDIPLGIGMRILPGLAAGVSLNLVRGSVKESLTQVFLEDAEGNLVSDFRPVTQVTEEVFNGNSASVFLYLRPLKFLELGGGFTPLHKVRIERTRFLEGVEQRARSEYDLTLPMQWSTGAALNLGKRWRIGADFDFWEFSRLSGRDDWADSEDEWTWMVGIERQRANVRRGGLNNLPVRLGFLQRRWGFRIAQPSGDPNLLNPAEPVDEMRVSVGTGFPFHAGGGHIDVAVSYATVGDLGKHGMEDEVWRLTVSIIGLEKWW